MYALPVPKLILRGDDVGVGVLDARHAPLRHRGCRQRGREGTCERGSANGRGGAKERERETKREIQGDGVSQTKRDAKKHRHLNVTSSHLHNNVAPSLYHPHPHSAATVEGMHSELRSVATGKNNLQGPATRNAAWTPRLFLKTTSAGRRHPVMPILPAAESRDPQDHTQSHTLRHTAWFMSTHDRATMENASLF